MIPAFLFRCLNIDRGSRAAVFIGAVAFACLLPFSAEAATLYWVGNDGAGTSTASNWKTTDPTTCGGGNASAAPTTADTIIFDRDCDNGAVVNSNLTVTTTTFQNGYAGIVSLNTSFTSTTFTQSGGTFKLNGQTFTNSGAITLNTGSTFTAGTGTLALTSGSVTIDVDTTLSLYNLTINATTATTKTIAASDSLIVTNTLTLTDGLLSQSTIPAAGTIQAQGAIIEASTFDGGTARIDVTGTGNQTFTGNATRTAGLLPLFRMNKSTGTLTLSGTIRTANNWNYSGGTLAFTNNTVVFGDAALSINGSHSLSNVIFDQNSATARTYTVKSDTTLIVTGTLTLDNSSSGIITINGGFIRSRGNINAPDNTMTHTGTTNLIIDGTGSQLLSGNATSTIGGFLPLNINKSSGTLTLSGTIRTAQVWSYSGGTLDAGSSTIVFVGTSVATDIIVGSHALYNVSMVTSARHTVGTGSTLTVNGTLVLSDGFIDIGKIKANGALTYSPNFDGGSGIIEFAGSTTRTLAFGVGTGSRLPGIILSGTNTTITTGTASVVMFGSYAQSTGTFTGGTGTGTIHGGLNVTGGTFISPTKLILDYAEGNPIIKTSSTLSGLTLTDGLFSYWKLDEGTGISPQDSSSRALSGATFFGGPTWSTDAPTTSFTNSYSLSFDGVDDYVGLPYTTSFIGQRDFSASVFVKTTATSGHLISMRDTYNGGSFDGAKQWRLALSSGAPTCRVDLSDSSSPDVASTVAINDGVWHHIACVRKSFKGYMYVDGVLTGVMSSGRWVKTLQNTVRTYLGVNQRDNASYFAGSLDDVRLYDRALNSDEITQLASGGGGRTYTLGSDLAVTNTLTLSRVTVDPSSACYTLSYGILVNTGATILSCPTTSTTSTITSTTPSFVHGGGKGVSGPGARTTAGAAVRAAIGTSRASSALRNTSGKSASGNKTATLQIRQILRLHTINKPTALRKRSMINRLPHALKAR